MGGVLSVPLKTVIMYHADTTNETIPASYEIADGRTLGIGTHDIGGGTSTYTLPNLLNRFILGADITKGVGTAGGGTDVAADAPGPKAVGGLNTVTLITANLPSHTHTGTTASGGAHSHTVTDPGHRHQQTVESGQNTSSFDAPKREAWSSILNSSFFTLYSQTGISIDAGGTHSHTFTTDATGSATGVDNRPRYYGLIFLMKVRH